MSHHNSTHIRHQDEPLEGEQLYSSQILLAQKYSHSSVLLYSYPDWIVLVDLMTEEAYACVEVVAVIMEAASASLEAVVLKVGEANAYPLGEAL